MATKLSKDVVRLAPSKSHDARKAGAMKVRLYMLHDTPMIELRVKGHRSGVEITIDGLYMMLVKASVR